MILCQDCNKVPATTTYGLGHKRCDACAEIFDAKVRAKRKERYDNTFCEDCGVHTGDHDVCVECCEHDDIEYPGCLICGKDMSETLSAQAEAYYEGER